MPLPPLSTEPLHRTGARPASSDGPIGPQATRTRALHRAESLHAPRVEQGRPPPARAATLRTVTSPPALMPSARAQLAMAYLKELDQALSVLKTETSGLLAASGESRSREVASAPLMHVQTLWQQRVSASLGALDPQLAFQADGDARRSFSVPGLDAQSLARPEAETLSFITGLGGPARIVSASLPPGASGTEQVRIVDRALAPAGVRLLQSEGDLALTLSTRESDWATVRDGFSVQGGGVRFPARQFHRLLAQPRGDALQPDTWRVNSEADLRDTLRQVVKAQQRVHAATQHVQAALNAQDEQLQAHLASKANAPEAENAWAARFTQDFARLGNQPPYAVFAALAPALQGLHRDHVTALLD